MAAFSSQAEGDRQVNKQKYGSLSLYLAITHLLIIFWFRSMAHVRVFPFSRSLYFFRRAIVIAATQGPQNCLYVDAFLGTFPEALHEKRSETTHIERYRT